MERPLTRNEVSVYERRLRDLHATLQGRLETLAQETFVPRAQGEFPQRADAAGEEASIDAGAEVYGTEEAIAYEVRDALERVGEGTFGRCEACEQGIERERLELVPHARLCAGCAREAEIQARTDGLSRRRAAAGGAWPGCSGDSAGRVSRSEAIAVPSGWDDVEGGQRSGA